MNQLHTGNATTATAVSAMTGTEAMPVIAPPTAEWYDAHQQANALWSEVRRLRAEMAERIGRRGLPVGTFTLATGEAVKLHIGSTNALKKFWARLPEELQPYRPTMLAAVQDACIRWDAQAECVGVKEMERQATGARDRAAALLARVAAPTA